MTEAPRATETREAAARLAVQRVVAEYQALNGPQPSGVELFAWQCVDAAMDAFLEPTLAPRPMLPMPWKLRIPYAWRALTGRIRPVSEIDTSQLEQTGWVEGRVRVQIRRAKP